MIYLLDDFQSSYCITSEDLKHSICIMDYFYDSFIGVFVLVLCYDIMVMIIKIVLII